MLDLVFFLQIMLLELAIKMLQENSFMLFCKPTPLSGIRLCCCFV